MNRPEFTSADDFEKENADLIEQIRSIREENLSGNFDERLASEIDKIPISSLKRRKRGVLSSLTDIFLPEEKNTAPVMYLSYTAAVCIVCFSIYAFLYGKHDHSSVNSIAAGNKTKHSVTIQPSTGHDEITNRAAAQQPEVARVSRKNSVYIETLHKKVLQNMHYGFISEPSAADVKKALKSVAFRKAIGTYYQPGLNDTVKVIVNLLEEK
ncbi:MAG: hypothetical protein ACM3SM_05435 [Bacteroidota bacterium]